MRSPILLYISAVLITTIEPAERSFPDDFLFGGGTSAFQIEGAWDVDGKGPSIWDEYAHSHPERILDHQNPDIAANSYKYFEDDIEIVKNLSMNFYRFSISWSRILPTGDIANINEKGIEYYNKVIDKCIENNIEPMVTMFHLDLPQKLQLIGGFINSSIVDYFEEYANLLFNRYGDRVKNWITINEPAHFCWQGYGLDIIAPAMNLHGVGEYLCGHNILKSHAVAYQLYKNTYYKKYKGKIGITISSRFFYSDINTTDADDRAMQFTFGWIAHPIYSAIGNYPSIMIEEINKNSLQERRAWSRLPVFSEKWINNIRRSADFIALNYYTSRYVNHTLVGSNYPNPSFERDRGVEEKIKPEWKHDATFGRYSVPKGIRDMLRWIKNEYNNPEIIITENGWSDEGGLIDDDRIEYLHDHLEQILDAILYDQVNLKGYTVWSIIDNFEMRHGYTEKFGLYAVNMSSPRRERTPKKSATFMKAVAKTHRIPDLN